MNPNPNANNIHPRTSLNARPIYIAVQSTEIKLDVYLGGRISINTLRNPLELIKIWIESLIEVEGEEDFRSYPIRFTSDGTSLLFVGAIGLLRNGLKGLDIALQLGHSNAMEIKIHDSGIFHGYASLAESVPARDGRVITDPFWAGKSPSTKPDSKTLLSKTTSIFLSCLCKALFYRNVTETSTHHTTNNASHRTPKYAVSPSHTSSNTQNVPRPHLKVRNPPIVTPIRSPSPSQWLILRPPRLPRLRVPVPLKFRLGASPHISMQFLSITRSFDSGIDCSEFSISF